MTRIPAAELERLKLAVPLVTLIERAGIALKPHGKDLVGRCPFHDDKTPSLVISPKSNLWHCLGACQMGGSVVDWVMRFEGVSFRRAIDQLRAELGEGVRLDVAVRAVPGTADAPPASAARTAAASPTSAEDRALLGRVIDYYHETLKRSPEAQAYLAARGLDHAEVVEHFRLGFCNRTLGYQLPNPRTVAREAINAQLQALGIYRASMREHFDGSLVVPVFDLDGNVTDVYGRKITRSLRAGTPRHTYLPGPHRGVFNEAGLLDQEEVILCEALIDALTFWCAGHRNVTASYGVEGFTGKHLEVFRQHGVRRVLIAYDADEAGNAAVAKLATKLMAEGFACFRVVFPPDTDANEHALAAGSAALAAAIRNAEWLGQGDAPVRESASAPAPALVSPVVDLPSLVAELEATAAALPAEPAGDVIPLPEPLAPRVLPSVPALPVTIAPNGELTLTLGDRTYRVRGIEKNLSYDALKVLVRASCGRFEYIDTLEFYVAKQRAAWLRAASVELGVSEDVLKADLGKLLSTVEARQEQLIRRELKPTPSDAASAESTLEPALRDEALALLRDPHLIERIVADIEACGVVGEGANALVGYLACVSRKLDKPLAIIVQSTSAAGKSTLMDALLALMPEPERVHYSAMTGQSLFYLGEGDLQHKILAIAEEEGVRQAAYALKLLQSQGELTIASTGKDPATGKLVTEEYRVRGPVMLLLTTTAIDVDEELMNRCLVLTINESREQTRAIHQRQRAARTLAGVLATKTADAVRARHQAAQQLLRPLVVVNPYAEQLTFRDESTRLRRDHAKYLTLIDAIALLHQHQRPIRRVTQSARTVEYVEVEPADIALANRLANEVLGRSLDELPPQTRRLLGLLDAYVRDEAARRVVPRSEVRFTRRELRASTRWSDTALKVHLGRLVDFEYLVVHPQRKTFAYELAYAGEGIDGNAFVPGLIEPEVLTHDADQSGENDDRSGLGAHRSGSGQGMVSPRSGLGPVVPMPRNPSADAACGDLFAIDAETAPLRPINGVSYDPSSCAQSDASSL